MTTDSDIDVIVELIGGSDGIAKALVEKGAWRMASMWSLQTRR